MKARLLLLTVLLISLLGFSPKASACDGLDVQAISVSYIGNGQFLVSIEYCEIVSNGVGASVHGILAEIVGANIIGTQTPSITSATTGVTMSFNQINATSAEWGDWDNDAAPIFMDSGDPMECFTVTLICDAAPTSVTFAGSSNNTNIGGGFQNINGRWACVETVIFPPPTCESDWTPFTYCPGSTTPVDLNATTTSVGDWSGPGVDPQTGMWDPTGLTGPVQVTLFVGDSAYNCQTTHTIDPVISTYNVITSNVTITCPEDSIEISGYADGGLTPWTYSWSSGGTDSNTWVPGDQSGSYTLTVNDACGGSEQGTVNVTYSPDPLPTISFGGGATQTICPGDQLNLTANVSGGSGNFTYVWSTSNTFSPQIATSQSTTVSPTTDTWYYVQVNDGCWTVVDSMRVLIGTVDITAINITDITSCVGVNDDGELEIIPNPVSGNYTFTINGGTQGQNMTNGSGLFTGLYNGTYQITVEDINSGCSIDTTAFISAVTGVPPTIGSTNVVHVTCPGAMNGSIELVNINGTSGNLPFDVTWTPTSGAPIIETGVITSVPQTHSQTNLYGSTWSIDIVDQIGCAANIILVVNEPDPIDLGLTYDEPLCYGQSNGSVYINATGGTLPYTFFIYDTDSTLLNQNNSNAAEQIPTGWYYTSLVDDNGCYAGDSIFLDQPDSMYATLFTLDPPCYGEPYGEAAVTGLFNNQGDVNYSWSPSGSTDSLTNHLDQGSHTITIVDSVGCIWVGTFNLTYPDSLFFNDLTGLESLCRGNGFYPGSGTVSATASGGTGTITYAWVGNGQTTNTNTWGNRPPGWYICQATDANGCTIFDSVYVDSLNPIADFTANPLSGTEPVTVTVTDQSQNRVTNTWSFYGPDDSTSNSLIIGYDSLQSPFDTTFMAGDHYVCLVVANDFECYDTLCQLIEIYPLPGIEHPNVFTPNEDGHNDEWFLPSDGMSTLTCTILNRWGNTVYVIDTPYNGTPNANNSWDGTNQNTGKPVSDGVYSYVYRARALNGEEFEGHGFIHVISK